MLNNDITIIQQIRMASRISFFKEFSRITKIWKATEENLLIFDILPKGINLNLHQQFSDTSRNLYIIWFHTSDAASGWAGWALAHLEFWSSVNPITSRGVDYALPITACPPGFEILATSLICDEK